MRTDRRFWRRRPGFTLVELLVVIGIIALLISILIPALARARQQAKQTACLSNPRQLGMVYQMYANDNKDQVPLGYSGNMGWTGYFLCDTGQYFPVMGTLYKANLLKVPQAFYCPAQIDPRFLFNTPENPWPPPVAGVHTRVGYTSRPTIQWTSGKPTKPMTRLTKVRQKAVLADVIGIPLSSPEYTNVHHKSLSVLYGDRSARTLRREAYDAIQKQVEAQGFNAPVSLYIDEANANAQALWNVFDRN